MTLEFSLSESEEKELEKILETQENVEEIRKNYLRSIEKTKKQMQGIRVGIRVADPDE